MSIDRKYRTIKANSGTLCLAGTNSGESELLTVYAGNPATNPELSNQFQGGFPPNRALL
ncbi:MAG: hypothetical protein U9Q81_23290 [Pseudomonadota bacterium]|nr:hypothetical protein [Pseudomonadota bacterium]